MEMTTISLDLAKNEFQVHGVNESGKTVPRKQLKRDQVARFSRTCLPAWSASRPAPARTTGPASCRDWVTRSC